MNSNASIKIAGYLNYSENSNNEQNDGNAIQVKQNKKYNQ